MKKKLMPRKEPQQRRSTVTLDAILEATVQLLSRPKNADSDSESTRTIAERAGVSVGSLYQYFPSKKALIHSLIGHHLRKRNAAVQAMLVSVTGLPAEKAVVRLVDSLIDEKLAHVGFERAMARYFCEVGDLAALTQCDAEVVEAIERFIGGLGTQARAADHAMTAFIINNALRSSILLALLQRPEYLAKPEFKAELVQLVVGYLKAEEAQPSLRESVLPESIARSQNARR